MMNQPTFKLRLRYVLAALIPIVAALSYQYGWLSKRPAPTKVQACAALLIEDFRQHAEMYRSFKAAEATFMPTPDFLTELCQGDPKRCGK